MQEERIDYLYEHDKPNLQKVWDKNPLFKPSIGYLRLKYVKDALKAEDRDILFLFLKKKEESKFSYLISFFQ